MNCPMCLKEMTEGYIPSVRIALQWIPKDESVPLSIFKTAHGAVKLTKIPFCIS